MNLRQKYIKAQKLQNAKEYVNLKKRIKNGLYPKIFSMPLAIQFEVTSECNLFCKHCYNQSSMYRKSIMTIENWKNVVCDIIDHGGIFQCIISGGEPLLLGEELINIMQPLACDGTGFVLITNGYLVNKELVDRLKEFKFFWVQVSIDHLLAEQHDSFRGKQGSWEKAVKAAYLFSSAGIPLRIAHSMTIDSAKYLPQFAELCYQLGASSLICGEIILSGRSAFHKDLLLCEKNFDCLYKTINDVREKYKNRINIITSANEVVQMKFKTKTPNGSIIIRPDGSVRLDCIAPFTIGNVLKKSFSDIWSEKGADAWQKDDVKWYLRELEIHGHETKHINHVDADIEL